MLGSALIALHLLAPPPPAAPLAAKRLDLKDVVDRVQKRYDAAADFRANFSQTLSNAATGRKTASSGEVLLKKPGRMRWNYQKPEKKMYLADGQTLWLYEPEDNQVFKQDLRSSQLPAALAFLTGKGKLGDEFEIAFAPDATYGGPKDYVLRLSPRTPQAQIKILVFVVDPEAFHVRESVLIDSQGNVNDMVFSDVKVNGKIGDETFRWAPPAGARVIDTAKLGQ